MVERYSAPVANRELTSEFVQRSGSKPETDEVIALSLTFDHRIVNGAGAANFVSAIRKEIENFAVPQEE